MRTRDQNTQVREAVVVANAPGAQPVLARLSVPAKLYRRSVAALYAQQKASADFRRVSRKLFQ